MQRYVFISHRSAEEGAGRQLDFPLNRLPPSVVQRTNIPGENGADTAARLRFQKSVSVKFAVVSAP